MDARTILCHLLLLYIVPSPATNVITADIFEARGQRVCRIGKGRPCYKLAYFSEPRRRLNFGEAELACRRDGGELLSVETAAEQKVIERLVAEIRPSDGDFWIGLRRGGGEQDSGTDCSSQYYWVDGSVSTFRNWHSDEPSCGYEVCVVMYHQPSAPPSMGGPYMFQWNDDNCETKNNFICKYISEQPMVPSPPPNDTQTDVMPTSAPPWKPTGHKSKTTAQNLIYIILPTVPLLLLLLTLIGVCCFKLLTRRRRKSHKSEVCQTEPGLCPSPTSSDVYNVIRSQKDDDLASARPHTKNASFLCSSPDTPTGDYDNLGGRDTESGFVTLASTESGFLNLDLNDLSLGRRATRDPRDPSDAGLGRPGNQEPCDRSLGRRTTKSEHYGTGSFVEQELYECALRGKSDILDPGLGSRRQAVKADLYQTYMSNGNESVYQTRLGGYGSRYSYQTTMDCYGSDLSFARGRRYYNEAEWVNSDSY